MISAAPRWRSLSTTNEPRKPAPPVTITRLSRQKVRLSGQDWEDMVTVAPVLIGIEVTQLPRERWHPAGSGSTELAERPPEMALLATA